MQHAVAGPQRREKACLIRHVLVALEHRHTQHCRRRLLREAVDSLVEASVQAVLRRAPREVCVLEPPRRQLQRHAANTADW